MNILSTTMVYPTPASPAQGLFVQRRLRALAAGAGVRVVCLQPWFPFWSVGVQETDAGEPLPVHYRRMFYLPGVAKCLDGWFYARALRRALREAGPDFDLMDAHFEYPDAVGAVRVARRLGVPVCVTLRGKLHSQVRYRLRAPQIRRMLREADGIVAVADSLRREALALAGADLDIRVIPNGVDDRVFHRMDAAEARAALGLPDGPRFIVSVGHLQEMKGFHRLVDVLPAVRRAAGDVRLLLVGGPTAERGYAARLISQVRRLHLDGAVELLGRQSQDRVNLLLNAADCFALATRAEGCCNAIQEALCAGAPVVTTAVGGNPELVHAPELGVLVPFGDAGALRDALLAALARHWDRDAIASVGRRRSWEQVARETLAYYQEVLSRA
jgi:glycosyltransferase involved in cell wall biosynthesis